MARVKDKRILKAAKEKRSVTHKGTQTQRRQGYTMRKTMQNNQTGLVSHIIIKNKLEMD